MTLCEYLNSEKNTKRILVVSDLGKGQDLLRNHEAITGALVRNVSCMTISQLLEAIYLYSKSESGFATKDSVISQDEAMMLFRDIMFNNLALLGFFNNEKMLDLITVKEIFNKSNLVRCNRWTGAEGDSENIRISDLKFLISEYENKLRSENLLDSIELLKFVINEIKNWTNPKAELEAIFSADISFLLEDMDELSVIEKEFVSLINNEQASNISLFDIVPSLDNLINCSSKSEFFRGYGSYNEASFVANDILSKNIPFGSVTVLYTSQTQLAPITAALQGNGLKANIVSAHPAQTNEYISLARRIIAWAKDDFSEKALEKIFASSVIYAEVKDGNGNSKNLFSSQNYFKTYLSKSRDNTMILGWGYKRNQDYIEYNEAFATDDDKIVLNLHRELLTIFGDGKQYDEDNKVKPSEVFNKLVSFITNNTSRNENYAVGIEKIKALTSIISYENRALSLKNVIDLIDELLASITISDSVSSEHISIQSLNKDWMVLSRPYVYIIGLSLKDMQGSRTESPVLSDEEMVNYLGNGYKPTIKNTIELKELNLYRTLMTFSGECIVFGYSSYDTVGFCENNPSTFFRMALQKFKGQDIKKLSEFVYGNPVQQQSFTPAGLQFKNSYDVKANTSSSVIEDLLDCPKKYYYSTIKRIPNNKYSECNYSKWLDAKTLGTFFHGIAEEYVDKMLIKPSSEKYAAKADLSIIRSIAEKIKETMLQDMPISIDGLADTETENLIKVAEAYFSRLHDSLITTEWRVLFSEIKFINSSYQITDYNSNSYNFLFSGIIDRIDYRIDKQKGKIYLRIIDYKTGKRNSKEIENNLGKLLQYVIYQKALMSTGHHEDNDGVDRMLLNVAKTKIAELENISNIDDWNFIFDSFNYVFPMETSNLEPIIIGEQEIEGVNITRLKCILTALEDKKIYPDHIDLINSIRDYEITCSASDNNLATLSANLNTKDETAHCIYCEYGDICERRKAGEIK